MPITPQDATQPPRWEYGPAGSLFIAKGSYPLVALNPTGDEKGTIAIYKLDVSDDWELLAWRDNKKQAVQYAEELVSCWFPGDALPTIPAQPKGK